MLPEKHSNTNTYQQKSKFVTVIHPEKLTAITTTEESDRASLVSWLFLIGSLMFLFDGLIELTEGISIHVLLHLPASVLFVIGSVLFIPTDKNS
ncbi:MAG: hypothetical protein QNJ72_07515 [Pleurocapsa sp. MO_226.B13]|nr:hypothetical protein [Pleurocapsa sp. MO_226.B13]